MARAAPALAIVDEDATKPSVFGRAGGVPLASRGCLMVLALGLLITAAVTWTSYSVTSRNEIRLLKLQTEQAGDVVLAAVPSTQTPLASAIQVAMATNGNALQFRRLITPYVGVGKTFASVSLWKSTGRGPTQIAAVTDAPRFATPAQAQLSVTNALKSPTLIVSKLFRAHREGLGYAFATGTPTRFAVYAEHVIPADRRSAVANNSAFSDLNYAIYLGHAQIPSNLLTTSFDHLPPPSPNSMVSVPFGNTVLTLVTAPRGELGGTLAAQVPWIFGGLGILLSLIAAWTTEHLIRRRRSAERDAGEIRRLYGELGALFGEQRNIAETLQRALLPRETPEIAGMEVAVKYVPGAKGMEIGGDWYSVMPLDDDRFAFVVGDVSGRGLSAATVMAGLRFTIRAYALEGFSPTAILDKCSSQLHVLTDGHFATVLVGVGNARSREVTLANAGHFNPLLIDAGKTTFLETVVGVPLGVSNGGYKSVTVTVPSGSTLVAFTDGLVEHRRESLDVGLNRLAQATRNTSGPLDPFLTRVVTELTDDEAEDDIAILGLRWKN